MWYEARGVVAFAGVHGAYGELTTLLRPGGVGDTGLCRSGGKTHLVSLGDLRYVDPGEYAAYALKKIRRSPREQPDAASGSTSARYANRLGREGGLNFLSAAAPLTTGTR